MTAPTKAQPPPLWQPRFDLTPATVNSLLVVERAQRVAAAAAAAAAIPGETEPSAALSEPGDGIRP